MTSRDFERAIGCFDEANRIDYSNYPQRKTYNPQGAQTFTDSQIEFFTPDAHRKTLHRRVGE